MAAGRGLYLLPFAVGNFLGPVLLGHFFDTVGRKPMIAAPIVSASCWRVTGWLFAQGACSAHATQTALWTVIFFFASAAASSAYLTVSEVFPLGDAGLAIALFYLPWARASGDGAPVVFWPADRPGSRGEVFIGYLIGAALMLGAALVLLIWGVAAERKPLEVRRPATDFWRSRKPPPLSVIPAKAGIHGNRHSIRPRISAFAGMTMSLVRLR